MSRHISDALRKMVAERAGFRCEYCRRLEGDAFIKFQIDHIISLKHGGKTTPDNLAYCCPLCNSQKGSDIGTFLGEEDVLVRFFNPRKHDWFDHFEASEGVIHPQAAVAEATIKIFELNDVNRILERLDLSAAGLFP